MKPIRQLTRAEALAFAQGGEWKNWTPKQRGAFQLRQKLLCMDFGAFHEGLEALLGRSVLTHEMADQKGLLDEANGLRGAPTMEEILSMIPAEKLIVIQPEQPQ